MIKTVTLRDKSGNTLVVDNAAYATNATNATKVIFNASANSDNPIHIKSTNYDVDLLRVSYSGKTSADHGFSFRYKGSGTGNNNNLQIVADNQTGTQVIAAEWNQDGTLNTRNIYPAADNTYNLGTYSKRFNNIYANNVSFSTLNSVLSNYYMTYKGRPTRNSSHPLYIAATDTSDNKVHYDFNKLITDRTANQANVGIWEFDLPQNSADYVIDNAPSTNPWHQVMQWGTTDGNYGLQLAHKYSTESPLYLRHKIAGEWKQWRTIVDSSNSLYIGNKEQAMSNRFTLSDILLCSSNELNFLPYTYNSNNIYINYTGQNTSNSDTNRKDLTSTDLNFEYRFYNGKKALATLSAYNVKSTYFTGTTYQGPTFQSTHFRGILNSGPNLVKDGVENTRETWTLGGLSLHFINKVTNPDPGWPSSWGLLLNMNEGGEVHLIWSSQPLGDIYHRGGNSAGWGNLSWVLLLDTHNTFWNESSYTLQLGTSGAIIKPDKVTLKQATASVWRDVLMTYDSVSTESGTISGDKTNHITYTNSVKINPASGNLVSSGNIKGDTFTVSSTGATEHLKFSRNNYNYITAPSSAKLAFRFGDQSLNTNTCTMYIEKDAIYPGTSISSDLSSVPTLGRANQRWSNIYVTDYNVYGAQRAFHGYSRNDAKAFADATTKIVDLDTISANGLFEVCDSSEYYHYNYLKFKGGPSLFSYQPGDTQPTAADNYLSTLTSAQWSDLTGEKYSKGFYPFLNFKNNEHVVFQIAASGDHLFYRARQGASFGRSVSISSASWVRVPTSGNTSATNSSIKLFGVEYRTDYTKQAAVIGNVWKNVLLSLNSVSTGDSGAVTATSGFTYMSDKIRVNPSTGALKADAIVLGTKLLYYDIGCGELRIEAAKLKLNSEGSDSIVLGTSGITKNDLDVIKLGGGQFEFKGTADYANNSNYKALPVSSDLDLSLVGVQSTDTSGTKYLQALYNSVLRTCNGNLYFHRQNASTGTKGIYFDDLNTPSGIAFGAYILYGKTVSGDSNNYLSVGIKGGSNAAGSTIEAFRIARDSNATITVNSLSTFNNKIYINNSGLDGPNYLQAPQVNVTTSASSFNNPNITASQILPGHIMTTGLHVGCKTEYSISNTTHCINWQCLLFFTITATSFRDALSFTWYPSECNREEWYEFSFTSRAGNTAADAPTITFKCVNHSGKVTYRKFWCGVSELINSVDSRLSGEISAGDTKFVSIWMHVEGNTWDGYGDLTINRQRGINNLYTWAYLTDTSKRSKGYKCINPANNTWSEIIAADEKTWPNGKMLEGTNINFNWPIPDVAPWTTVYYDSSLTMRAKVATQMYADMNVYLAGNVIAKDNIYIKNDSTSRPVKIALGPSTVQIEEGELILGSDGLSFGTGTIKYSSINNIDYITLSSNVSVSGNFAVSGTSTFEQYVTMLQGGGLTSDIRYKENIQALPKILPLLESIPCFSYTWTKPGETSYDTFGVSAQDLEKNSVTALTVHEDNSGTKSVEYSRLSVLALQACKELKEENDSLKKTLNMVLERLSVLEKLIENKSEDNK